MITFTPNEISRHSSKKGEGLVNSIINKLPIELHLPGYQYCGPGTKLKERLERGDPGINPLDQACKQHDIAYSKHKNLSDRHIADKILAEKAWQRVKDKSSSISEKLNAYMTTNIMAGKIKLGMGVRSKIIKRHRAIKKKIKKLVSFGKTIRSVGKILQAKKPQSIDKAIKIALITAKKAINKSKSIKTPRVISIPKNGGAIPFLLPLFAGLSAMGSLSGGAATIAKVFNEAKMARKTLAEMKRHNQKIEGVAVGEGLYLKPYRKGLGLYLNSPSKNY